MTSRILRSAAILATALAALTGPAGAQGTGRSTAQINGALDGFFGAGGTTEVDPDAAAAVDPGQFRFSYDPAVSERVHALVLDSFAPGGDAAARTQLEAVLDQLTPEVRQQVMDEGFQGGWRADDLADVVAASVVTGFAIVQDMEETTPAQDAAVRDLIRVAFDGSPMTAMTDAQKQETGELLLLGTLLTAAQVAAAREAGDVATLDGFKAASRDVLAGFGLHPALFTLGPEGLEQSERLREAQPRIEVGETTFEEVFPDVVADYARLGSGAAPAVPGAAGIAPRPDAAPASPEPDPGAAGAAANPLGVLPADPVAGAYAGEGLELSLAAEGTGYAGTILFGGRTFPVRVALRGDALEGTFEADGASFPVIIRVSGDAATLETGGRSYALVRSGPANPLAGGADR